MNQLITPQSRLLQWAESKPEKTFLFQPKDGQLFKTDWKTAADEVAKMASYLKKFAKGSRIAILSLNCDDWIKADLAIMAAGHISVPIYPTASGKTISQIIRHAEVKLVFVGKLQDSSPLTAIEQGVERVSIFKQWEGLLDWNFICNANQGLEKFFEPTGKDIATIVYTSGTTGMPKGVVICYQSLSNAFESISKTMNVGNDERFFSYLPLAHVAERVAVEMGALFYGCEINFVESLDTFARDLCRARPTIFFGVPRIWLKFRQTIERKLGGKYLFRLLINLPFIGKRLRILLVKKLGLDKAWLCLSGAASISRETLEWFDSLGIRVNEVYGMSETLGLASANTPQSNRLGTVGKPVVGCEILVAENEEILIRTPSLMDGYYKEPDLTNACVQDDWMRTGDRGTIDEDGFLSITGRAKDLFKTTKGKYVSPIPLEEKISELLQADQACVMGEGLAQPVAVVSFENAKQILNDKKFVKNLKRSLDKLNSELEKHERIAFIGFSDTPWTTENELMTPTLKIRRQSIEDYYIGLIGKHLNKGRQFAFLQF